MLRNGKYYLIRQAIPIFSSLKLASPFNFYQNSADYSVDQIHFCYAGLAQYNKNSTIFNGVLLMRIADLK
ncbi:unnamed protein product, partial [Dicrocoelium dendriticum]